jgi:hypothetical protein
MMPRVFTILSTFALTASASPAFAHPGHALVEAGGGEGMLPIAVVLGIGALTWLWNHRPQPAPVGNRKPPSKGGDNRKR